MRQLDGSGGGLRQSGDPVTARDLIPLGEGPSSQAGALAEAILPPLNYRRTKNFSCCLLQSDLNTSLGQFKADNMG